MSQEAAKPYKARALVVDDRPENRALFTKLLETLNVQTQSANNGQEALNEVKACIGSPQEFDVIFLDIMMPEMNGIEAAKQLRGMGYKKPILAFSAESSQAFRKKAKEVGVDHYFVKHTFSKDLAAALIMQYCKIDVG